MVKPFSTFCADDPVSRQCRRHEVMGHFHKLALVALASLLAVGCATTPETQLSWGVNTRTPKKAVVEKGAKPKTYAYQDKYAKPTPRPSNNYVSRNVAPYAPVTS